MQITLFKPVFPIAPPPASLPPRFRALHTTHIRAVKSKMRRRGGKNCASRSRRRENSSDRSESFFFESVPNWSKGIWTVMPEHPVYVRYIRVHLSRHLSRLVLIYRLPIRTVPPRRFLYLYLVRDRVLLMERGVHLAYASCLRLHCFPFIIAALRTLMRRPRPYIYISLSLCLSVSLLFFMAERHAFSPSIGSSAATSIITYISFVSIFSRHSLARSYAFVPVASLFFFFSPCLSLSPSLLLFFLFPFRPRITRSFESTVATVAESLSRFIPVVSPSLGCLLLFFIAEKFALRALYFLAAPSNLCRVR